MNKVETYIDAVRERAAIERAIEEEGQTPERLSALRQAKDRMAIAYGRLNGGQIAAARRALAVQS
jgi:hypothetical protein